MPPRRSATGELAHFDAPGPSEEHRTVTRVMAILEAVIANEPSGLRLAELAAALYAPKSSIHGIARGLVATGYLRQRSGRYYQGPAVTMLVMDDDHPPAAYHHTLESLSASWQETAILSTLAGDSVINIDISEPNQMIRAAPPLRQRRPLCPGSLGKVLLAFMAPRRRDGYLSRKYEDPFERQRILADLETVRTSGIAYDRGETLADLYGVASPILMPGSDVTLALGMAGPAHRMSDQLDDIAGSVLAAAQALSKPSRG